MGGENRGIFAVRAFHEPLGITQGSTVINVTRISHATLSIVRSQFHQPRRRLLSAY
jgi:hypothetical protein